MRVLRISSLRGSTGTRASILLRRQFAYETIRSDVRSDALAPALDGADTHLSVGSRPSPDGRLLEEGSSSSPSASLEPPSSSSSLSRLTDAEVCALGLAFGRMPGKGLGLVGVECGVGTGYGKPPTMPIIVAPEGGLTLERLLMLVRGVLV
jgi:hypothetical protein